MLSLICACASVDIHDKEVCLDMLDDGATCIMMLSEGQRDLTKSEWDAIRLGRPSMSQEDFARSKVELEELCMQKGRCAPEVKKKMDAFFAKMEKIKP